MKHSFLSVFFCSSFLGLVLIAACNFILDGDAIYVKRFLYARNMTAFSSPSDFAVTDIEIDERLLKRQMLSILAEQQRPDCVVIGSSRAMLVSSIYKTAPPLCHNLINLAAAGAGVEDALLMAYYLAQLPQRSWPKILYIDLSHWSFHWGAEESWKILKRDYPQAYSFFMDGDAGYNKFDLSIWANLLSLDYFIYSLQKFFEKNFRLEYVPYQIIRNYFSPQDGPKNSAIIRDGSRVYSAEQRREHKKPVITGTEEYKIFEEDPDPSAIDAYIRIANYYTKYGTEVFFFAMPYHSALLAEGAPMANMLKSAESALSEIRSQSLVNVIGSFVIEDTQCSDHQMMDFMHPDDECVRKIMRSR